jgi:hypothetical protein
LIPERYHFRVIITKYITPNLSNPHSARAERLMGLDDGRKAVQNRWQRSDQRHPVT